MSRKKLFLEIAIAKIKKLTFNKRQRFVLAVLFLSLGLFFSEHLLGKSGFFVAVFLSLLTAGLFFAAMYQDVIGKPTPYMFILPFLYTFAFGLFYFLMPARFLTRVGMTFLYGIGLYSLFLSQNIFVVASIRTIALLSGARLVSYVITLVSYFFLVNIIFTLHLSILPTSALLFFFSFFLITHSLWTVTLDNVLPKQGLWVLALSICLFEIALLLWFWPTTPTVIAIFLTGFFYMIVGLSHAWFDKRLFKGVIWEYIWVGVIVLFILISFTSWRG